MAGRPDAPDLNVQLPVINYSSTCTGTTPVLASYSEYAEADTTTAVVDLHVDLVHVATRHRPPRSTMY